MDTNEHESMQLIWKRDGAVMNGAYLLPVITLAQDATLGNATLTCLAPSGSPATLTLLVNGLSSERSFVLPAGTTRATLSLGLSVEAGDVLRWQCSQSEPPDHAPARVCITVEAE